MRAWLDEWLIPIAIVIAVVCLGAIAVVHARRVAARCTDNGGTWTRVNCRTVEDQLCMTTDFGNGMMPITTCQPTSSTRCDTVCRGARAEDGGR